MNFICDTLYPCDEYKKLSAELRPGACVYATGLSAVHKATLILSMCRQKHQRALCIAADEREAATLCEDLCSLGLKAVTYPKRDFSFRDVAGASREYEHKRIGVLLSMIQGECDVVVACIDAAAQLTIPPEDLKKSVLTLSPGQSIEPKECVSILLLLGYERCDSIEGEGQFSLRGGILDFFAPGTEYPVRVEFWGDEIDSVNLFDLTTQRRTDALNSITLSPSKEVLIADPSALAQKIEKKASYLRSDKSQLAKQTLLEQAQSLRLGLELRCADKFIRLIYDSTATLFDYCGDCLCFVSELSAARDRLTGMDFHFEQELADYFAEGVLCRGFDSYSLSFADCTDFLVKKGAVLLDTFSHSYDLPLSALVGFTAKQLPPFTGSLASLCDDLDMLDLKDSVVIILTSTDKAANNTAQFLCDRGLNAVAAGTDTEVVKGIVYVIPGYLSSGFEYPHERFYLFSQSRLQQKPEKRRVVPKNGQALYSLSELTVGDYVVHTTHGVGLFGGIRKIDSHGIVKDYIVINYAKGDVLYVPVTQLDLVAKYIGPRENSAVKLNRLGGTEWQKAKSRVRSAVKDMAKELIALYSQRMQAQGYAFSGDTQWQRDFESKFEYEETPDQLRCADEIRVDMQRTAPMDRLLCGDVGFGKTEVALRAAFRCISDSKQCALLCPTTILAWQHYQTVLSRFEGFPVKVELLSRFRTAKQQKEILRRLSRGEIDMVIGTHRLVSNDVVFRDLGLVIIDEEQRFGVAQKERFKEQYKNIDVLTLSATPIPRTLNMAMSGIRDMSVLEEAPQNRYPVQTYVLEYQTPIITEAIRKELRRGGQVFFLHNNVDTISTRAARIQQAVPEARVGIGHGKMSESELSAVWKDMLEQQIDVLVCTTIIETGVDVPNANTLIIEDADKFGLSQLHQLRGRVGRSTRRAYAYLTFLQHKSLSEISQKRLTAIREFTEFGSGFRIAMRDLELRGAGNILGAEQHGHMEDVGYDMYLKMLGEAVSAQKGELPETALDNDCLIDIAIVAHIPESYIESLSLRLDVYRLIADIRNERDASEVTDELIDRFGNIPNSVVGLIDIALIRNKAAALGIYEIRQNDTSVLMYVNDAKKPELIQLVAKLKGDALLSAGSKPYISVRLRDKADPLSVLRRLFCR